MFMCCVASTFYGDLFFKQVILAEFRCPQATVPTALGCLQCISMQTSMCVEGVNKVHGAQVAYVFCPP